MAVDSWVAQTGKTRNWKTEWSLVESTPDTSRRKISFWHTKKEC